MTIHTSRITTEQDGDLSIDPNGTGEVKLTKLAGQGEIPLSVNSDGEVGKLDNRDLTELETVAGGDILTVQRGDTHFKVDADEFVGGGIADPTLANISWIPGQPPGSGTLEDPFVLTPAVVATPGGSADSVEQMALTELRPGAQVLVTEQGGTSGLRFEQGSKFTDDSGAVAPFSFEYNDTPASTLGEVYNGLIRVGSSIYISWEVTQVANNTIFGPGDGQPTASPATVDYAADDKFGTVTGVWADGSRTLQSDGNVAFSVQGGNLDTTNKFIQDGQTVAVAFVDSVVAAASEGDQIAGTLSSTDETFYFPISMVKDTTPAPYSFNPLSNVATNTEATTGLQIIPGFNAPTTLNAVGGSTPLTSIEVSVNGAARVAASGVAVNPGDTIQLFGTTGGADSTAYTANVSLGGVTATWSVTTAVNTVDPTIGQPSIISPLSGSTDLEPDVTVVGSTYVPLNGAGSHSSSTWEVYEADGGSSLSPSIINSDDGDATPLTLSGASPAGLIGDVVQVTSTSPTVIGGETQPDNYTLTTTTITSISENDYTAGINLSVIGGDGPFKNADRLNSNTAYGNGNGNNWYIDFNPPLQVQSSMRIAAKASGLDNFYTGANAVVVNGVNVPISGSLGGGVLDASTYEVNVPVTFPATVSRIQMNGGNINNSSINVYYVVVDGTQLIDNQPILSFGSPNPDLQYFKVGDLAQGSVGTVSGTSPAGTTAFFTSWQGPQNTSATYTWTFDPPIPGSEITYEPNGNVDGSTSTITLNGSSSFIEVGSRVTRSIPGGALSSFTYTFNYGNSGNHAPFLRNGTLIDGNEVQVLSGTAFAYPEGYGPTAIVQSIDVAANTMTVDGGNWALYDTSQTWSTDVTTTSIGYEAVKIFDGNPTTFGGFVSTSNWSWDWTSSFTVPPGSTLRGLVQLGDGDRNAEIRATINGVDTVLRAQAPGDGLAERNLYTNNTSSDALITRMRFINVGSPSQTGNITIAWLAIDNTYFADTIPTTEPTVGASKVTLPVTATGTVAAATGSSLTLNSVTGRWIGSGSENFGNQTFYAATVANTGAPSAPVTEPPGAGYTQITPSATTLTTATLDDSNLEDGKYYFSRVKYSDGSVESPFSAYNQFSAKTSVIPQATPGSIWKFTDSDASFTEISSPVDMVNFTTGYNWIAACGVDGNVYTGGDASTTVNLTLDNRFPTNVVSACSTYGGDYNNPSIVFLQASGQVVSYLDINTIGNAPPEPCTAIGTFGPVTQYLWARGESGKIYGWANSRIGVASVGSVPLIADQWTDLQIQLPGGRTPTQLVDPGSGGYAPYNLAILADDGTLWAVNTVGGGTPGFLPGTTNTNQTPTQYSAPGITFTGISPASASYNQFGALSAVDTTGRLWYGATAISNNYGTGFEQVFDEVSGLEGQGWLEPLQGGYFTYGPVAGVKADGFVYVSDTSGGLVFRRPTGQTVATSSLGSSRFCQQYAATVSMFFIFN